MKNKNTNILYTYVALRSFVSADIGMISTHYNVVPYHFKTTVKKLTPISFVVQFLYLLFFGWRFDVMVCFFAGYHSVLPAWFARISGKRCIIFLGGTECFKYPSFKYGNFTRKWYGKATCISAHKASLLIPVSENLILSHSDYYTVDSTEQGIYHWCKPLLTPYQVIPLEYDVNMFQRRSVERTEKSFITVAFGIEGPAFTRKGIDKFLLIANHFSACTFTIIGSDKSNFPVDVPPNVKLIPPVPHRDLPRYYSQHQFYLQMSIAEGFPSALCEAMLCECIPIGSSVAAIPDIIGEHGFIVAERRDDLILDAVQKAIDVNNKVGLGKDARQHIMTQYGPGKRINELIKLFSNDTNE